MSFPVTRPRRLRRNEAIRSLARETHLSTHGFIYPMFVCPGKNVRNPIGSMPGVAQQSVDMFLEECREVEQLGIPGIILFGIIENGEVKNDPTLELLAAESLSHARAGADIIAPSDMMDGRVGAIRKALDAGGFEDVTIMSYAAKYCSGFYGPFREAAESAPQFGDRRGYQMDPANARESLRGVELDLAEGADMVMVKPARAYLDIIQRVREAFSVPVGANH